jgi:hypothetical protein
MNILKVKIELLHKYDDIVILKVDKATEFEANILDRFAVVTERFELAAFKSTCFEVKAAEFMATTVAVELAAAV